MPHIIVEYSKTLESEIPALLNALHEALANEGIDKARIKTRGFQINHAVIGEAGEGGQMLHATLLLLAGRDTATKKQYGDALHKTMQSTAPESCATTLEIRDMDADIYYL